MRSRLWICGWFTLFGSLGGLLTCASIQAQMPPPKTLPPDLLPPTPIGPATKGVIPASGVVAPPAPMAAADTTTTRKATPFDRFHKYDDLPELTREIVFATQRGMEWLSRDGIHQLNGRFIPGLNPSLGKALEDDTFIYQATGALALARSARLTGDEKYAVRAGQTILTLLAETPKDAADPTMRKPAQPESVCNRVGAAAYLALAIYELPEAPADLRQCADELCQFLRGQFKPDGSIATAEMGDAASGFAGPAIAAIAVSNRMSPAAWKTDTATRSLAYCRQQFRTKPHSAAIGWLAAASADMHLQTKQSAHAEFVFEMADWVAKLQYEGSDRQRAAWRGGFPVVADGKIVSAMPTVDTAYTAMALAEACRMIRQMDRPDAARYDRYRAVLTRGLQFLITLQYSDENTVHFAAHFRPVLVGAFHPSLADGNLRVDQTAVAVCAFTQFLIAGADR